MDMNEHAADDRHRPRYHFLPPANWMNDPNGLIFYKGSYHLFYQYNPNGAFWGTMHWGHAISEDLVHWRHMPIALAPNPDGPDRDGCYSGAAVVHDGVPTLVYTGVRGADELPCLATSEDDDLATWRTFPGNPVVPGPPASLTTTIFRDHTLWREDRDWLMGVGSGIAGQGGAVLLYRTSDLVSWDYLHPLVVEDPELNPGGVLLSTGWECPDFFFLGNQAALVACDWDGDPISVSYWTGKYRDRRFWPDRKGTVDPGSAFYAPQSFEDAAGRRVMFGWLRESRSDQSQRAAGWSGVMSLPRIVTGRSDGSLAFGVAPEVATLRKRSLCVEPHDGLMDLKEIPGDAVEIAISLQPKDTGVFCLGVRCSPDAAEETEIRWEAASGVLSLDTRRSSLDPDATGELASATIGLDQDEPLSLRVFIDCSVIEVFANDRVAISGRMYPTRVDSLAVRVTGADEVQGQIIVYEMLSATPA